ncbi:hypothetical protein FG87_22070 [Nocardia vulneris]|uniref:Uncharacterized protein n=1 Tax=Nocardia vulneris TaxID=1141657 RepID=A0ABR4ZD79_9NOCA|nr:hypothetical protein FG87_22070 [Nocardia vulneris]
MQGQVSINRGMPGLISFGRATDNLLPDLNRYRLPQCTSLRSAEGRRLDQLVDVGRQTRVGRRSGLSEEFPEVILDAMAHR